MADGRGILRHCVMGDDRFPARKSVGSSLTGLPLVGHPLRDPAARTAGMARGDSA